jgi:glutathione S-transferase
VLAERADARADLARIVTLWTDALEASHGPFLFGEYSIADAYFAPVVMRLRTYALPVPAPLAAYMEQVIASPGVAAWVQGALAEREFLPFEEDYRTAR